MPPPSSSSSTPPLPLAELHQRLGARMMSLPQADLEVPAHYGSVDDEYAALRQGCGLLDRSWAARLEMTGEDRNRFLNGLVTCDVRQLAEGDGAYGFFTDPKGKVLADVVVRAGPTTLWLELPCGQGQRIADHLRKYLVIDRVEITSGEATLPVTLCGPQVPGRLRELLADREFPESPWRHVRAEVEGIGVRVSADGRWGVPAWTLWVAKSEASTLVDRILASAGVIAVGYRALDLQRIEKGVPWYGRDFGPDRLPQETGIEEAVSYEKGCYLGQEVVARLHYRGQVSRMLRGLEFEKTEPPAAKTGLLYEGRQAGEVTSSGLVPGTDRVVGIGIVQRRAMSPGTRLQVEGGGEAEVRALGV